MLTFKVWDVHNKTVWFRHTLSVSLITEESAPADGLKASFAVSGDVPALRFVEVFSGQERLFCGAVDEQTVLQNKNGTVLTLAARSRAAVLLDNEARPQTYIKPYLYRTSDDRERHERMGGAEQVLRNVFADIAKTQA